MTCSATYSLKATLALGIVVSLLLLSPPSPHWDSTKHAASFEAINSLQSTSNALTTRGIETTCSPSTDLWERCSPRLKDWAMKGTRSDVLRYINGEVAIAINLRADPNWTRLEENLHIVHVTPIGPGYLVYARIANPKALTALLSNPDVIFVFGDEQIPSQVNTMPESSPPIPGNSFESPLTIAGVERVWSEFPDINGSGIVVGVVDSGVDFGCTDLVDAIAVDEFGRPLSYDPGGSGIALTSFMLPSVGGYLFTEGLDFRMFHNDGNLYWSNSTYGIYSENCYIGGFGGLQSLSGFYRLGMSVQTAEWLPKNRAFFLYTLVDEYTAFIYDTLYIDFETS